MDLCVYSVERLPEHAWLTQRIYCTDVEGTHLKITVFNDDGLSEYEFSEDQWYRIGPCPTDVYGGSLGIKVQRGTEVAEVDDVEIATHPGFDTEDPSLVQLGVSGGRVAIDIETVATVPEQEIEAYKDANRGDVNPEHYELVAAGVGYQPRGGGPNDTEVIFREDTRVDDEFRVVEAVVVYVRRHDVTTLLTFGGTWFDLQVLRGRAEIAAEMAAVDQERVERVHRTLDNLYHADLKQGVYRVFDGGSLEKTAKHAGTEVPTRTGTSTTTTLTQKNLDELSMTARGTGSVTRCSIIKTCSSSGSTSYEPGKTPPRVFLEERYTNYSKSIPERTSIRCSILPTTNGSTARRRGDWGWMSNWSHSRSH
jgi:hypothetical protein